MYALTDEDRHLLRELKKYNASAKQEKKRRAWKSPKEITRLTVWTSGSKLEYARKHNLIHFELERKAEQKKNPIKRYLFTATITTA